MVEAVVVDRICDLYASGAKLAVICREVEMSLTAIQRVLAQAADIGDARLLHRRRIRGERRLEAVLGVLESREPVTLDQIAKALWLEYRPGNWRVVVRGLLTKLRKAGHKIQCKSGAYTLG